MAALCRLFVIACSRQSQPKPAVAPGPAIIMPVIALVIIMNQPDSIIPACFISQNRYPSHMKVVPNSDISSIFKNSRMNVMKSNELDAAPLGTKTSVKLYEEVMLTQIHTNAEIVESVPIVYCMTGISRFGALILSVAVVFGMKYDKKSPVRKVHTGDICQKNNHDSRPENVGQ